ncbi:unnamed protein product [Citrullus colocynthis]|uniref:Protein kinase domain-containing protein n=1 Tax=Citrullus colocynthis TaxID=252529 RepID=A0ABP0XWB4_9ROSI
MVNWIWIKVLGQGSHGFVHMDLKSANILAFPQSSGCKMKLKIVDFGLSKRYEKRDDEEGVVFGLPKFRGTSKYMSPESIVLMEANNAFDIWSLGCILVKMVSGKSVWNDCKSHQELITRLLDDMETPTIPKELSKQGKDFIQKCFDRDYKQRWIVDMLLEHPYLSKETKSIYLSHQPFKIKTQPSNNGISTILV